MSLNSLLIGFLGKMGQKVTFDGVNRIINVTTAPVLVNGDWVVDLDVKIDLFSDGKEDWLNNATLNKLKFPISSVGGNPLPGSKALGATFFLDASWKIRPYEANHIFRVNGNLYATDGSSPFTATLGSYNIFLEQQVSSLVDSTVQQLEEIEYGSFAGHVSVDVGSTLSGTAYPAGNNEYPVNNIPDAVAIAADRGIDALRIIGNISMGAGDDVSGYQVEGQNAARSMITLLPDAETNKAEFRECVLTGTLDGDTIVRFGVVYNLTYVNGFIYESMLSDQGEVTLGGTAANTAHFLKCYSGVPGPNTPTINCNGDSAGLAIRSYSGGVKLKNKTGTADVSVDFIAGQLVIDLPTVTNGTIVVRGNGKVIDQNGNHLLSGTYGGMTLINEANYGEHLHDIWGMLGLDKDNPMTIGPTGHSSDELAVAITDNQDGTYTLQRQ